MARTFNRLDRIGEQIQKDLSVIIQRELKDPRLGMVTINSVRVSKDLGYSDIYFTVLNTRDVDDQSAAEEALGILNEAAGFLRSELSHAIKLRTLPQLRFHYDRTVMQAQHISSLIDRAITGDKPAKS